MLDVLELSVCCLKKRILFRKIENYFLQAQRAMMTGIDDDEMPASRFASWARLFVLEKKKKSVTCENYFSLIFLVIKLVLRCRRRL